MRIARTVAILACLMAGAAVAAAQTPEQRIETALTRARGAGIPIALLETKIAEGRAKGVSMDRIAGAVERREAALERASQALGGPRQADSASLAVAADAVEAGVSAAVLRAIADTLPRERRVVAIATLTELVALGQAPEVALARVREALQRGPDALANLPAQAAAAAGARGGGPPETGRGSDNGRGNSNGPPEAVPAPGGAAQPARPGGPPAKTPGGPPTNPGRGRSGGL